MNIRGCYPWEEQRANSRYDVGGKPPAYQVVSCPGNDFRPGAEFTADEVMLTAKNGYFPVGIVLLRRHDGKRLRLTPAGFWKEV